MTIEFIESKNVGAGSDLYKERADWLDQQVSKAVLGQTATTDAIAGGHAVGKEHRQVQEDIERADARRCPRSQPRPGAAVGRPRVWAAEEISAICIGRPEEKDIAGIVDATTKLVPLGFRAKTSEFYALLGLSEPKAKDEVLAAAVPSAADTIWPKPGQTDKSKTALHTQQPPQIPRDAVDDLADAAELLSSQSADAMINTIRQLLDNCETLDEVRDRLLELVPEMPAAGFAEVMRRALAMAELTGRSEIAAGV
jgi:phage gp29-like protein